MFSETLVTRVPLCKNIVSLPTTVLQNQRLTVCRQWHGSAHIWTGTIGYGFTAGWFGSLSTITRTMGTLEWTALKLEQTVFSQSHLYVGKRTIFSLQKPFLNPVHIFVLFSRFNYNLFTFCECPISL